MKNHKRYSCFIGRWQIKKLHSGHRWLIDRQLKAGKPVLILVRDVEQNEINPYSAQQVKEMIERELEGEDVKVMVIPDIESVNYGRGVGYDVIEWCPPEDIGKVSATEIRKKYDGL